MMKLNGRVSQHDKYQVEVKFVCPLDPERKVNDYHIDIFFFLPHHLGINRHTYSRDQFYADLTEYIRLKTPEVDIRDLIQADSPVILRLIEVFDSYRNDEPESQEECTRRLKMFCSVAKVAFRVASLPVAGLIRLTEGRWAVAIRQLPALFDCPALRPST